MVENGSKVTLVFQMKDESGKVWDEATEKEPLEYVHGKKQLLNVLEAAMTGKKAGETFSIEIPPEKGYGERDEKLLHHFPKEHFKDIKDLKVGMVFQPSLDPNLSFQVVSIDDDEVLVDANHPLAGKILTFEVKILKIEES